MAENSIRDVRALLSMYEGRVLSLAAAAGRSYLVLAGMRTQHRGHTTVSPISLKHLHTFATTQLFMRRDKQRYTLRRVTTCDAGVGQWQSVEGVFNALTW